MLRSCNTIRNLFISLQGFFPHENQSSTTLKENIHTLILFLEYLIQHNSGSTSLVEYLQYIQF